jgi:hypothetical protein
MEEFSCGQRGLYLKEKSNPYIVIYATVKQIACPYEVLCSGVFNSRSNSNQQVSLPALKSRPKVSNYKWYR